MTPTDRRLDAVWEAISDALHTEGDGDMRAGLAFIGSDADAGRRIAQAALDAIEHASCQDAEHEIYGGGGSGRHPQTTTTYGGDAKNKVEQDEK